MGRGIARQHRRESGEEDARKKETAQFAWHGLSVI
jgi:hypothetical protein